jgi:hypothetical protein
MVRMSEVTCGKKVPPCFYWKWRWVLRFCRRLYWRLAPSSIFQHGGRRVTRVGSSTGTPLCIWDTALVTLTLAVTTNLCPCRTDVSTLHKQFLPCRRARARARTHARTHTRSACRSVLGSFESVSRQSVQLYIRRVEWMLGRVGERRMKRVKKTEKYEERERQGRPQSDKYFLFVSIWQPYGILMTGQSRRISRVEISTYLVRLYSQVVREVLSHFADCSPKL